MIKTQKVDSCALQLENLVKIYGSGETAVHALKGVSICFRKNEFVSVLGPSGCGKTTLLNIIGGLDRYNKGNLKINGKSTKEYKDGDWDTYRNESIGFVFQSYNLIPHQTVLSNVELALTLSGVGRIERRRRAKAVLEKVGLKGLEHKLPNQMSGGQMQRVAIARALVNDPEIILADEPTGALDTETSIQVMELLKEVAKDRLVIMVTHNPELAKKYSTRTIQLLDGEMTGDSNPYIPEEDGLEIGKTSSPLAKKPKKEKKKKSAMNLLTAFSLSLSNLFTKKGRTILTSIAGSIGIIGIALVLAVSTGFSSYIENLQAETLSVYPLTISEATIDLTDFEELTNKVVTDKELAQKLSDKVYTKEMFGNLTNMLKSNKLTDEYVSYVSDFANQQNAQKRDGNNWEYCVQKGYGFDVNDFIFTTVKATILPNYTPPEQFMSIDNLVGGMTKMFEDGMKSSEMGISVDFVRQYIPTLSEIPSNQYLVESQYDLIYGDWATNEDELLLVVDKYNRISDITLALLGFRSIEGMNDKTYAVNFGGDSEFTFKKATEKDFYFVPNDLRFENNGETYVSKIFKGQDIQTLLANEGVRKLGIKGVVRLKDEVTSGVLKTGIAYTSALNDLIIETNKNSQIVEHAKTQDVVSVKTTNPLTLMPFNKEYKVRSLAGTNEVTKLSLYSIDYLAKENLKVYLDAWNDVEGRIEEDKVHYSDSTEMLFSAMNSIVDAVKIVLICFTSISLVVSSIMIGIITYVSVVERTKEIGVLRSIGARKKDISRIFNAETFLVGLFAGLIGVAVTYLLSIPINLIFSSFVAGGGAIAALRVVDAFTLVIVSFALTLVAGVIPSRIAAKKDPVVALRTE